MRCPRCAGTIPVAVLEGCVLLTCAPRGQSVCGQHIVVIGLGRVAAVAPISPAEYEELLKRAAPAAEIARSLGILGVPLMPAA